MDYDTFVEQVRQRGGFDSRASAESAVAAVLGTLAERLPAADASHLANALPPKLQPLVMTPRLATQPGVPLLLDEIGQEVGAREGVDAGIGQLHAQVVVTALAELVGEAGMDVVYAILPRELNVLIEPDGLDDLIGTFEPGVDEEVR